MSSSLLKRRATPRATTTRRIGTPCLRQLTIKIDLGSQQVMLNDERERDGTIEDDEQERELDEEERNSWGTPTKIVRWLREGFEPQTFWFVGDACASQDNHVFPRYFTEKDDAMVQDWTKGCTTCCISRMSATSTVKPTISAWFWNGPYNKTKAGYDLSSWFAKCYREACKGVCVVMLVPAPNGTKNRYDAFVYGKATIVYDIPHRLRFKCPRTGIESRQSTARFGSQLVVFDPRPLCKNGCAELAEGDTFDTVIRSLDL